MNGFPTPLRSGSGSEGISQPRTMNAASDEAHRCRGTPSAMDYNT